MTKNQYQQMIRTYQQRREDLKEECRKEIGGRYWLSPTWKSRSSGLNSKLRSWTKGIKRWEKRQEIVSKVTKIVEQFAGFSLRGCARKTDRSDELIVAENILYKFGMENGAKGCDLAYYTGHKRKKAPCERRMKFSRSFGTNTENYEIWQRFKRYAEDID